MQAGCRPRLLGGALAGCIAARRAWEAAADCGPGQEAHATDVTVAA